MAQAPRDQNYVPAVLFEIDGTNGEVMAGQIDQATGRILVDSAGGSGTVTSVSVVTANGFAGTVANATSTPAITIQNTIDAPVLAGAGVAIAAASTTGSGNVVALSNSPTFVNQITTPKVNLSGTSNQLVFQSAGVTGTLQWAPATSNKTITLPNGSTDFTATGGTGNVLRQSSAGAAITVGQLAASDLSNGTTGSGSIVLATSPTLVTPVLGVATATSINGLTITTTTGTLTLTNAKTLSVTNTLTLSGTDGTTMTFPSTSGTVVTLDATQELDNKTLDSSVAKGTWTASGTWTVPALTTGGNITLGQNTGTIFNTSISANGQWSGDIISITSGTNLMFGDLAYLASNGTWLHADADSTTTAGDVLLGVVVTAASSAGTGAVLLNGTVYSSKFPTLTAGAPAYVSITAGSIQTSKPSGTDDVVRVVGFGLATSKLYFNPSGDYITIV